PLGRGGCDGRGDGDRRWRGRWRRGCHGGLRTTLLGQRPFCGAQLLEVLRGEGPGGLLLKGVRAGDRDDRLAGLAPDVDRAPPDPLVSDVVSAGALGTDEVHWTDFPGKQRAVEPTSAPYLQPAIDLTKPAPIRARRSFYGPCLQEHEMPAKDLGNK